MDKWRAEYAVVENEKVPFMEFLQTLNFDEQLDIIASIDEVLEWKNNNMMLPPSKSKYLGNKIFEMRVKHQSKISRSLFFYEKDKKIIFTNGFIKKTQKTPKQEIDKAQRIMKYFTKDSKEIK